MKTALITKSYVDSDSYNYKKAMRLNVAIFETDSPANTLENLPEGEEFVTLTTEKQVVQRCEELIKVRQFFEECTLSYVQFYKKYGIDYCRLFQRIPTKNISKKIPSL